MRRNISPSRLSIVFCILLLMTFSTNAGFAQSEEASQQLLSFSYFQVKPGMDLEFEALIKNVIPLLREWGVTDMDTFKISNFGMSGRYLFISSLMEPAAMDAQLSEQRSNMIPVAIVSLMSTMSQTVESIQDFMLITMPDFNIPAADDYETKLIHSVTIGTVSGRSEDFKNGIKEVVSALGRTNVKGVLLGQVGIGGNLDEYMMFVLHDSFEEMISNEAAIQKEFSEADLTSLTGVVTYRKSEVLVRVPELCMQPEGE